FVGNSAGDDSRKSSRLRYSNYGTSPEIEIDTAQLRSSLSFKDIYKATENFSAANQIGEGGFGTVYKGKLKDGSVFAVKRAKTRSAFVGRVQERDCSLVENRAHEFGTRGSGLEIGERLDIAIDVAHAVTYLHTYS
ncbi:hypothetical protein MIMGU_mgv11b0242162mg, partial [Erythranthe guttata]